MRRVALTLALVAAFGCVQVAAAKPDKDAPPPEPAAAAAAPKPPAAAPPDKEAPPPVTKRCLLANGAVRVLTIKQKKCRQTNSCACAEACPACP